MFHIIGLQYPDWVTGKSQFRNRLISTCDRDFYINRAPYCMPSADWQTQAEDRPLTKAAAQINTTVMPFGDGPYECQSQPAARDATSSLTAIQFLPNMGLFVLWDTRTGIGHFDNLSLIHICRCRRI